MVSAGEDLIRSVPRRGRRTGGVKVEIRMMFYRPEGESRLTLGLNLCRLSRGKMLGVDFNKDFTWVGSSVAIRPAA